MRRDDFPVLEEKTYLDSACMSLRPEAVIEKVEEYYREYPACSGRSAHSMSERASEEVEEARSGIAGFIDASPGNLVFTSGTTESINTVADGFDFDRVFTSDREHNSNLVPWQRSEAEHRIVSTEDGFDLEELDSGLEEGDLVSVFHASNLDGKELPVEEIVEIARENGAYTLIDAAQSIPHQQFSVREIEADFVVFSGHKMLGPSGTGALYVSDRVKGELEPLKVGGGAVKDSTYRDAEFREFPHGMEPGLPNIAGFIGFGEAVRYLESLGMENVHRHEKDLTGKMRDGLESIENTRVYSEGPGIASFRVQGMESQQVALMLAEKNIAVRAGNFCVHSWFNDRGEKGLVRASLYLYNNEEDVEKLVDAVRDIAYLA